MKITTLLTAATAALALVSCTNTSTTHRGGGGLAAYKNYDVPTKKPSNPSAVRVKVSTSKQLAYVMEGNEALMVMPISVGTPSTPTPKGSFTIFNKEHHHRANTHGYAYSGNNATQTFLARKPLGWRFRGTPMPYWCEFKPNYGFHTGWLKDTPCTHGCIRMHENVAPKFFSLVRVGTPVSIASSQPEDATIGRNVPRPPDAGPLPDNPPMFYIGDGYFTQHKSPSYN